ncbi:MAG: aminoglycoside phosphotransferase [Gammaproteobacteria bacterium SG8_30]|nr:MAG: aminoglycoside phosphotransferase [Gammaproteobacteria bacterium SG8_30]
MTAGAGGTAGPVRRGFEIDEARLDDYLRELLPGYAGPLSLQQFAGGQSNPTYRLRTPGRSYVLRRKPPGVLLPSAHAVDREYRVIDALGRLGGVPVPRALHLCLDESVIGTSFYVMECVEGRILRDAALPEVPQAARPAHCEAIVDALARLHRADYRAAGLGDFGRAGGYVVRQFSRWSRQYLEDTEAGRNEDMDRLVDWLPTHMPGTERTTLVHGDYRCDNLVFHPEEPRVLAILDWELATLGDPIADFTYHLMMYRMPPLAVTGLAGRDLQALNLPPEDLYVRWYCERMGLDSVPDLDFYLAFNLFKLAAVFHGIRGRLIRGTAAGATARAYAACVEEAARLAWQQARRAAPG